ncbi:hypothetical protein [Sphingobacterium hotanense]|uniref:hypothetical protein n=1 Tax=Sphingobacterium hotanense TaxID=649196 RepID=UPI0021A319B2|nr:hypothetical protein [Sphingobacterium hotanense]MCT1526292.1 hypothetical protein [Sphingobacterium hotanense]
MDQLNIFRKALENPLEVSEADFQYLLSKYPYAQPIVFANERRKQLDQQAIDKQKTLLYAYNAFWLRDYLQKPVKDIPELEVDSDDYISFEEVDAPSPLAAEIEDIPQAEDLQQEEVVKAKTHPGEAEKEESKDSSSSNKGEEEQVTEDGSEGEGPEEVIDESQLFDYEKYVLGAKLRSTARVAPEVEVEEEIEEEEPAALAEVEEEQTVRSEEDISLYNDELMPYSFRWWLYKTRLEHADTYQPFAQPVFPKPHKGQFDPRKLDEAILDQQIRENIFHLQNPEDKLSAQYQKDTVEFNPADQKDEVIEKFIRAEPQIQPPKAEEINNENKARKSSEDRLSIVTETLANIYEGQAMYEKAILVFKKLISENPEKKSYFATRIKELEQKL